MKKKWLMIIILMLLPLKVYAAESSVTLTCDNSVIKAGGTTNCYIKGTVTSIEVSGVSANVKFSDSNLSLQKISYASGWEGEPNSETDTNIELYSLDYKSGTFDIATIVVKASSSVSGVSSKVSVDDVSFVDSTFEENSVTSVSKDIRIASNVNTLSSITLSSGTLSPSFAANTSEYTTTLNVDKVTISATTTDSNAKVTGTGEIKLNYGINTVILKVTSESGDVKQYTISITRPDDRDTDNTLVSINVGDKEFLVEDNKYEYSLEVDENTASVELDAKLNSDSATFVEGYGPRSVNLKTGKNEFEIKVQAENGEVTIYKVNVTRKESGTSSTATGDSNPKTGDHPIMTILIIMVFSIVVGVGYYEYYRRKVKKDTQ